VWRGTGLLEELIAAAHAGCVTMPMPFVVKEAGCTPPEISVGWAVSLESVDHGFRISSSALTLRSSVPNLDQAVIARIVKEAEQNCPVSGVLNGDLTLGARLVLGAQLSETNQ
jgi:lipoyl-dependent peroxiredoxin